MKIASHRYVHHREVVPKNFTGLEVPLLPKRVPLQSREALEMQRREEEIFYSFQRLASYELPDELLFEDLCRQWKKDTLFESSPYRMAAHPAYKRIISMGWKAVPWILKKLSQAPDFWFEALYSITNAKPVPQKHAGNMRAMTEDWLAWGRRYGFKC